MSEADLLRAAVAFLEAWEHENHLHNMASADNETYFAAAVKTAERALAFRLALPRGVSASGRQDECGEAPMDSGKAGE